ncbi:MAG: flagellin [Acetobacteraceae bacterium]
MSMTVSDYGSLGVLVADSQAVNQHMNTLAAQQGSGFVSNSYGGLGAASQTALTLLPQIAHSTVLQNNINVATSQLGVTQSIMTQLQSIATNFYQQVTSLPTEDPATVDTVASTAQQALVEVANLLNTKDGDTYIFAGTDSTNPPVSVPTPPDTIVTQPGGFYAQINAAISGADLSSTAGANTALATAMSVATSDAAGTTPFSATIGTPAMIETGVGLQTQAGLLANQNTLIPADTSPASTGSYVRDLMLSLATLGSMSSAQGSQPGYDTLLSATQATLSESLSGINAEASALGGVQGQLTGMQTLLGDTSTALTQQVSSVDDVDMAKTLSDITLTQTQLESSYKLIASVQKMSLTDYI